MKVFTLLTCLVSLSSLSAEEAVVRWGGNYLAEGYTGNLYLNRGAETVLDIGQAYPDLESPRHPKYDTSKPSAVFYGMLQTTSALPVAEEKSRMQVRYENGENRISICSSPGAIGNTVAVQGLIFWKKDGFLDAFAGRDISSLSALKELALRVPGLRGSGIIRFAVQSEGKWFLSEAALEARSRGPVPEDPGEFRLPAPGSRWGQWSRDPLLLDQPPVEFKSTNLRAISAVGFYFSVQYAASNAALLEIDSFEALGGGQAMSDVR